MSKVQEFEEGTVGECEELRDGCLGVGYYTIDPYQNDVHDVKEWKFLCESCHYEMCMDI